MKISMCSSVPVFRVSLVRTLKLDWYQHIWEFNFRLSKYCFVAQAQAIWKYVGHPQMFYRSIISFAFSEYILVTQHNTATPTINFITVITNNPTIVDPESSKFLLIYQIFIPNWVIGDEEYQHFLLLQRCVLFQGGLLLPESWHW